MFRSGLPLVALFAVVFVFLIFAFNGDVCLHSLLYPEGAFAPSSDCGVGGSRLNAC